MLDDMDMNNSILLNLLQRKGQNWALLIAKTEHDVSIICLTIFCVKTRTLPIGLFFEIKIT